MGRAKNILFLVIVLLLFLPMLQKNFSIFRIKPLKGAFTLPEEPVFSLHNYFSGEFQDNYNTYLEQQIGLRPILVRVNNQIAFTFFRMALANAVVIGKHNYLYEENYIKAYLGSDFLGEEKWNGYVDKLKQINEYLTTKGIYLIFVFAPGKGSFFPEYIPHRFHPEHRTISNQQYLLNKLKENNLRYIDFNNYFVEQKSKSPFPLYSKTGIHWSSYGEALALDSIITTMEHLKNQRMVDFGWSGVVLSNDLRTPDDDIGEGMNLLFGISHYAMPYPTFYFKEDSSTFKPIVITVTDSYYWNLHGRGITQRIYNKDKFWYYYKTAHGPYPKDQLVKDLDVLDELESADFVILMATDANLYKFDFGFTEQVYKLITDEGKSAAFEKASQVREAEQVIRNNEEWMKVIQEKAAKRKITVDEMIHLDAVWMIEKKQNEKKQ